MPTVNPSAFGPKPQFFDAAGNPDVSYKLFMYVAGSTSTKQNSYTNSTGSVANTNPIILNALGQTPNELWWDASLLYKVVLAPATDTDPPTNPVWTIDNLQGMNSGGGATAANEWVLYTASAIAFVNASSFTLVGNQTVTFHIGRRLQFMTSAGFVYGRITNSVFAASTTVTMQMDGNQVLDSGLSAVYYSILTNDVLALPGRIATATGTNTYTATVGIARLAIGDEYELKFTNPNDGTLAPTLNLDSMGALPILLQNGLVPSGGFINGEHIIRYTTAGFILINPIPASASQKIQPLLQPSINAGALTVGINPTTMDFRSTTAGSPVVNTRVINTAVSLTLPSGSALGAVSAVSATFILCAIDNAGTVEPTVINLAGGNNLDETTLISTVAISTIPFFTASITTTVLTVTAVASGVIAVGQTVNGTGIAANTVITSLGTGSGGTGTYNINNSQSVGSEAMTASANNVFYSTTARTNVPFKVMGFYNETNPVAGVHSVLPTLVQGTGGQALVSLGSFGFGQTYQDVTVSRVSGTTYYNTTIKPLFVSVVFNATARGNIVIGGITVASMVENTGQANPQLTFVVQPKMAYVLTMTVGTFLTWVELR